MFEQYPRQKPGFLKKPGFLNLNAGEVAFCRLGGTQWNPTFALGSASLHPTYKKMAKVLPTETGFWQNHPPTAT